MAFEPRCPGSPYRGWQYQVVPEFEELVDSHVVADVFLIPFPKDLFVNTCPLGPLSQIVSERRTAPPDMERQLDATSRLDRPRVVNIIRHSDRTCCGAKPETASPSHGKNPMAASR